MTAAWLSALLQRCSAEHFPKKPEDMWAAPEKEAGALNVVAMAKAMRSTMGREERLDEIRKRLGRKRKKKRAGNRGTVLRAE